MTRRLLSYAAYALLLATASLLASRDASAQFATPSGKYAGTAGASCAGLGQQYAWPDANGNVLKCVSNVWTVVGLTAGAAGSTGYIQFNSSGVLAGDSNLFWDNTNKRLGIGSTSPVATMEIYGPLVGTDTAPGLALFENSSSTAIPTDSELLKLVNTNMTNGNYTKIGFSDGVTNSNAAAIAGFITDHAGEYGELSFWTRGATNWAERLRIASSGNVGIGTTAPMGIFDVNGGTAAPSTDGLDIIISAQSGNGTGQSGGDVDIEAGDAGFTGQPGAINLITYGGAPWGGVSIIDETGTPSSLNLGGKWLNGWPTIGTDSGWNLSFATNNATQLTILGDATGNVGIGSTAPVTSLDLSQKTDALALPVGTTGQEPASPLNGMIRYNTTLGDIEAYIAGAWTTLTTGASGTSAAGGTGQVQFNSSGALAGDSNLFWDNANKRLGIGTGLPTYDLSFGGQAARTMWMEREATASTAGNNLTISAGGAKSGGTDLAGGTFLLSSGISTGTGFSNIQFQTYPAAASTSNSDNAATTILKMFGTGSASSGQGTLTTTLKATDGSGTDKNGGTLNLSSGVSTGTGSSNINFKVYNAAGSTGSSANSATTAMTILGNGNVGVGTTSPAYKLEVPWISGDTVATAHFGSSDPTDDQPAIFAEATSTDGTIKAVTSGFSTAINAQAEDGVAILGTANFLNAALSGENFGAGPGVSGFSAGGLGIFGHSYGAGNSGLFQSDDGGDSDATLVTRQSGANSADLFQAQDSSNNPLTVINSAGHVGIGSAVPVASLDLSQNTDALALPVGTTAQEPGSPINGMIRYNTTLGDLEAYVSGAWTTLTTGAGGTSAAGGTGQVQFNTAGSLNADGNFFWDNTNKRLGIGTTAPSTELETYGTSFTSWWTPATNDFNGTLTPASALTVTDTATGGTDAVVVGRGADDNNALVSSWAIGAQAENDYMAPNQGDTFYVLNRDASGLLQTRLSISSFGAVIIGTTLANAAWATGDGPDEGLVVSGYVGIGVADPGQPLEIGMPGNFQVRLGGGGGTFSYDIGRNQSDGLFYFYGNQGGSGYVFSGVDGERMRITGAGNVGIGTSVPLYPLHVFNAAAGGGSSFGTVFYGENNTGYHDSLNARVMDGITDLAADSTTGLPWTNLTFSTRTGSGALTEKMRIDNVGNVGIGTTAPGALLSVGNVDQFSVDTTGAVIANSIELTGINGIYVDNGGITVNSNTNAVYSPSSSSVYLPAGMGAVITVNPNGADGSANGVAMQSSSTTAGHAENAYIGVVSNISGYTPTIVFGQQTGATAYAERMRIDASGNVGIGTATPISPLSVLGNVASGGLISVQNTSASGFSDTYFYDNAGTQRGAVGYANSSAPLVAGTVFLASVTATPVVFGTNAVERIRIDASGNVGIGSASPNTNLDLGAGFFEWGGEARVSSDFAKTNSTLAAITGLSVTLVSGKTYAFDIILYITDVAAGGTKVDLNGGTVSATSLIGEAVLMDSTTVKTSTRTAALNTALCSSTTTSTTDITCHVTGTITVNAGGTFKPEFAENTTNASASTVKAGSVMLIHQIN